MRKFEKGEWEDLVAVLLTMALFVVMWFAMN